MPLELKRLLRIRVHVMRPHRVRSGSGAKLS
jgi:hypothetical protein